MEDEGMRITVVGVVLIITVVVVVALAVRALNRTTIAAHGRINRASKSERLKRNG